MAILPAHSTNYFQIRKNSFRAARRKASQSEEASVSYRGRNLTAALVRRMHNCPPSSQSTSATSRASQPRGGRLSKPLRRLSWNPGHLGNQQWSEIKDWLASEASQHCDVLVAQETHWKASSQFQVAGWTRISSASSDPPKAQGQAGPKSKRKTRSWFQTQTGALPDTEPGELLASRPSTTKANGVMVRLAPWIDSKQIRWREHDVGRLLEVRFAVLGARFVLTAVYQHVWSAVKSIQQTRSDGAGLLAQLSKAVRQVAGRDSLVVAGDFNAELAPHPRLVGPCTLSSKNKQDNQGFQELITSLQLAALNTGVKQTLIPSSKGIQPHTLTSSSLKKYKPEAQLRKPPRFQHLAWAVGRQGVIYQFEQRYYLSDIGC